MSTASHSSDQDELLFAFEEGGEGPVAGPKSGRSLPPWQVLVVDDEPQVHLVSRLAFSMFAVEGRAISLIRADSAEEARSILASRDDIAVGLFDVVMETDDAGLELAAWVRTQPRLRCMRVILRTGQAGLAPEETVLRAYDINDYWPKTELTAHRMRTLLTGQVRSYRDLRVIERQRVELDQVLLSVSELMATQGLDSVAQLILERAAQLPGLEEARLSLLRLPDVRQVAQAELWRSQSPAPVGELSGQAIALLTRSIATGRLVQDGALVGFVGVSSERSTDGGFSGFALLADGVREGESLLEQTLELFARNALSVLKARALHHAQSELLHAVERFVPERLVRMAGSEDVRQLRAGDHRNTQAWVVFADLHGFTGLSELLSPDGVHALLQEVFAAVSPVIGRHHGVIDKFFGDGFMALFDGAMPPPVEACREMLAALERINLERVRRGEPRARLSMAIHGGQVLLCAVGSEDRIDITAVSDAVNVTARLEHMTRTFDSSLLVSHEVWCALDDRLRGWLRPLGTVQVRGRRRQLRVYDAGPEWQREGYASAEELQSVVSLLERGATEGYAALDRLAGLYPKDLAVSALVKRHAPDLWTG